MYLSTNNKNECMGCTACKNICPKEAIKDEEGFEYPYIDKSKCVNCELCNNVCPWVNNNKQKTNTFYGAKLKDLSIRKESSSGSVFTAIAKYILENRGTVYGDSLEDDYIVSHIRIDNIEDISKLQKSKYVQSRLDCIFKSVKKDLKERKLVLFTGTPCQIDGLHNYLKNDDTKNLYTCDLICHGVPSPKVFSDYLAYISNDTKKIIRNFDFRDKKYGWGSCYETFKLNNKKIVSSKYRQLFYSDNILRPSCYTCQYSTTNRVGDITIGDIWGIENIDKNLYDRDGVSLVIINSTKGNELFNNVKDELNYFIVEDNKKVMQRNLVSPTSKPDSREKFWEDYKMNSFKYIINKYTKRECDRVTNPCRWFLNKVLTKIKRLVKQK